ncbi:hypothetical protein B0F90DRAFT_1896870 [Multifurca ochricompacta]|uniref:Dicer-like protein 1 n=1 Tax=Multifurca ochricompacta TaxID=376703 RepID=A0AAD4M6P4_9AGAM|nr:hypothetical protein B0F90DRAFT_1896870 [Multifurca ochricompacta]
MTLISNCQSDDVLVPRQYQEEIFLKSQQGNVIAVLDTGTGKTLISALLIKWVVAQTSSQKKVIIFLVPKVPLVEQQGNFIAKHTALRVERLHSDISAGVMDRTWWGNLFARSDVLVMTGQIFLNILTHSHWSIDKVSLLVFDECHHARKNHPYTSIMSIYRACPETSRPKIFGMTACPTWSSDTRQTTPADLEKELNSKFVTVREHLEELAHYSSKPIEVIREFPPPPQTYLEYPIPHIWSRFDYSQVPASVEIPWQQLNSVFGAELFLYSDLQTRISELSHPRDVDEMELLRTRYLYTDTLEENNGLLMHRIPEMHDLCDILAEYQPFFERVSDGEDPCLVDILLESYTPEFHGIVFVDRRHIARVLSSIISRIPILKGIISCASCVGHGGDEKGIGGGMPTKRQRQIVNDFRDGKINLLIATPVAEEGLDFPACDIIVRFDAMQDMVGYVQSRGRARRVTSTFVVMVQRPEECEIEGEGDSCDYVYPTDLAKRECFLVPSTGAILTYNTAIGLLGHLCALIPCDAFTPAQKPRYSGDFVSTVWLPSMLPLPREHLVYEGPRKHSKKEAKRAVAFKAVKALYALGVFDDHLLPAHSKAELEIDEDQSQPDVPEMMDVVVISPWALRPKLWSHPIIMNEKRIAGIVTGTPLPPTELVWDGTALVLDAAQLVYLHSDEEFQQRRLMQDYTDLGLWWRVSSRPRRSPLSCFLVPLVPNSCQPDFREMERFLKQPYSEFDWMGIHKCADDHTLVINNAQHGRLFLLHRIRFDLTPLSKPPMDSREAGFETYREYHNWCFRKRKCPFPEVPTEGPLIEATLILKQTSRAYQLLPRNDSVDVKMNLDEDARPFLFPLAFTRLFTMSEEMSSLFGFFPRLLHRVQDVWRARNARIGLGLPPILDDHLIEATTLPAAAAGFNNQRLETLGDSVLKLCTSVHLYNKFPYCHEGQLDHLRRRSISNRPLMARAKAIGLEHYLNVEGQNVRIWPTVVADDSPTLQDVTYSDRIVKRRMARRSLQDCMEAIIGAGYLSGGIPMAIQVGSALGLNFGGPGPWQMRYTLQPHSQPAFSRYTELQDGLGYEFQHAELLQEALMHSSFWSGGKSNHYGLADFRVEAVVDLVVMTYLHKKFPQANSGQLSSLRSRAVCGPVLAFVAVRVLNLHKFLLANNSELIEAIEKYIPILHAMSSRDMVLQSWAHDPPKTISDILESVVAAILIDSGYNLDKTMCIVEAVMQCVLEVLSPDLPPEPVSAFFMWAARSGCKRIHFRKSCSRAESKHNDTICVVVHDTVVVGPVTASSLSVARAFASERARTILTTADPEKALIRICDCKEQDVCAVDTEPAPEPQDDVDDATEIGFATAARIVLERFRNSQGDIERPGEDLKDENS